MLLLTALVSLLLAFLLGNIASPATAGETAAIPAVAVLKRSRTVEKRVRFSDPVVEEHEELLKDLGSDAVDVGDEFRKENMLSIASTEVSLVNDARLDVSLVNDARLEVNLLDIEVNLSDVASKLDIEAEIRDSVNEGGLEGESVTELQEVEIEEADVELPFNVTKMEAVESVEFDIETGSRVGDGSHELEGKSVINTPEIVVTGKADVMGEILAPAEPDIKVESRGWDVNQVNEAELEGEIVDESPKLPKISVVEVESGDRYVSQGNEFVMSELLGVLESSTAASEQKILFRDASQVNTARLEGELMIESSATLEITEFDAESARDAVKEEIIELPKSSYVVNQLEIEKKYIPVVSQVKEVGLGLEIKNVDAESATYVAEEENIIIQSPESGGIESVESLLHGEDEWEGLQRRDMEKLFRVAASYTSSTIGVEAVSRLSSDAQMEL